MRTLKGVTREIKDIGEVRGLLEVYEELAATKMQRIRKSVTLSKEYFEGLARISEDVALDFTQGNLSVQKEAALLLSADAGLFGDIIDKLLVSFVDYVNKNKVDTYVLGKLGKNLLATYAPRLEFKFLNFPMDNEEGSEESIKQVMQSLSDYKKVSVFHGQFQTIATQVVTSSNITGSVMADVGYFFDKDEAARIRIKNIYEPSIGIIGEKFAKEISASIFSQSLKENQLAKYASRLIHLDSALENIDQKLRLSVQEKSRMRKKIEQKKQTERVSRMLSSRISI